MRIFDIGLQTGLIEVARSTFSALSKEHVVYKMSGRLLRLCKKVEVIVDRVFMVLLLSIPHLLTGCCRKDQRQICKSSLFPHGARQLLCNCITGPRY